MGRRLKYEIAPGQVWRSVKRQTFRRVLHVRREDSIEITSHGADHRFDLVVYYRERRDRGLHRVSYPAFRDWITSAKARVSRPTSRPSFELRSAA